MEPNENPTYEKVLTALSWDAPEYEHVHHSPDWYWALWIISISLAITSVILKNTLLGILIVLAVFGITLFGHRKPRIIKFKTDQQGIYAGDTFYPYAVLESFSLEEMPGPRTKLILKSHKKLMPFIAILIPDDLKEEIRYILNGYLLETNHKESVFVKIVEYLGL